MKIAKLSDALSVSPQICPEDVEAIAAAGFKTLINNRPDGEEEDQPGSQVLGEAASAAGIAYYYQPVVNGAISPGDIHRFARNLNIASKPALAFCRTGTRSSVLWLLNNKTNPDKALKITKQAGYNLEHLKPLLV